MTMEEKVTEWMVYIRDRGRMGIIEAAEEALDNGWITDVQFVKIISIMADMDV